FLSVLAYRGYLHSFPTRRSSDLGAVQRVEGVEELFLEPFFAFHELDVVNEQDVAFAVTALESGPRICPNGIDEFVHERLRGHVPDRKSTRLNSSHGSISYAVFCL